MSDLDHISVEEWNAQTPVEQLQYVRLLENSDGELRRLLALIPACPAHGDQCIPHAADWIKARVGEHAEG